MMMTIKWFDIPLYIPWDWFTLTDENTQYCLWVGQLKADGYNILDAGHIL